MAKRALAGPMPALAAVLAATLALVGTAGCTTEPVTGHDAVLAAPDTWVVDTVPDVDLDGFGPDAACDPSALTLWQARPWPC